MKHPEHVRLHVKPCELIEANRFIGAGPKRRHRHHDMVQGHRFSIKAVDDSCATRSVATCGRPVGRNAGKPSEVLEVTRLCSDGTPNACSILYAAAARIAREMGFWKVQTYILDSEPGTSLLAAGWICEGEAGGGFWSGNVKASSKRPGFLPTPKRAPRKNSHPVAKKAKWSKIVNPKARVIRYRSSV